jgi:hypothetical protein
MTKKLGFEVCLAVIVLVTAIDIFWSVYLSDDLLDNEKNPLARLVILLGNKMNMHGVGLLCALKVMGAFFVVGACRWIYKKSERVAWPVVIGVTLFQAGLFFYLHYGHLLPF